MGKPKIQIGIDAKVNNINDKIMNDYILTRTIILHGQCRTLVLRQDQTDFFKALVVNILK